MPFAARETEVSPPGSTAHTPSYESRQRIEERNEHLEKGVVHNIEPFMVRPFPRDSGK